MPAATTGLSEVGERALAIYEARLRPELDPAHRGEVVAIHVDSGDHALGPNSPVARRVLRARHPLGEIVTFEVGLPVTTEHQVPYPQGFGPKGPRQPQ